MVQAYCMGILYGHVMDSVTIFMRMSWQSSLAGRKSSNIDKFMFGWGSSTNHVRLPQASYMMCHDVNNLSVISRISGCKTGKFSHLMLASVVPNCYARLAGPQSSA